MINTDLLLHQDSLKLVKKTLKMIQITLEDK